MQFLYSLFLITTLFTSLQAMEAEVVGHAAQEAEEAAASEKAKKAIIPEQSLISTYLPFFDNTIFNGLPTEIKNQIIQKLSKANTIEQVETKLYDLSNQYNYLGKYIKTPEFTSRWLQLVRQIGAEETKKASDARDLRHTQQKAAPRVKPEPQKKEVVQKLPQFDATEIFGKLFKGVLPDEVIAMILPHIYNASSTEEVGNILHTLSLSSATIRRYLNTPAFTKQWGEFTNRAPLEGLKFAPLNSKGYRSPAFSAERLGTNHALDEYIYFRLRSGESQNLSNRASAALTFITSTAAERNLLNINGHKFTVPVLARLLETRTFNPNQLLEFREIVNGNIRTITQLPLTYVLRHNGPASLVKDLLDAGALANGDYNIDAAMEKPINKNTSKNIQLLIAAKADVTKTSEATISKLLNSADPASIQILGTLLEHHAPVTPAHVRLANELLQGAIRDYPANNPARDKFKIKADLINHYASTITKARVKVGL